MFQDAYDLLAIKLDCEELEVVGRPIYYSSATRIWVLAFTSVGKYDGTIKGVCPQGKVVGSHNVEFGCLGEPTPKGV